MTPTPEDLARRATAALERAREACGDLVPHRSRARLVALIDQVGATVAKLAAERGPRWREAKAAWEEAQSTWWALAGTARHILAHEVRKCRGVLPEEDLHQEGWFGLYQAARRFDPSRGIKFVTVARWWARAAIVRAVDRKGWMLTLSAGRSRDASKARRFLNDAAAQQKRLNREQLAELVGVAPDVLDDALAATRRDGEEAPLGEDGNALGSVVEMLPAEAWDPDSTIYDDERTAMLVAAIEQLDERSAEVVRRRLSGETLNQVGEVLDLSRERVRQVEAAALKRITKAVKVAHG